MDEFVDKKLEEILTHDRESQKKDIDQHYYKKFEEILKQEWELQKKEIDVLYDNMLEGRLSYEREFHKKYLDKLCVVCTNFVFFIAYVFWSYNMTYVLCIAIVFMMQKLAPMGVIVTEYNCR